MAKHRIRITGAGIYGQPTDNNPTGEIPIGTEFETDAALPTGWAGRAVIVGEEPKPGAQFVVAEDDGTEEGRIRNQIGKQALDMIEQARAENADAVRALTTRAERAESDLQAANEQLSVLRERLKAFDRDGAGNPGGSNGDSGEPATADEIKSAIGLLDGTVDAHWTAAGLPAVDAVAELTGKSVTRDAIKSAAPDAKRPA
jgi:hypothetical protein